MAEGAQVAKPLSHYLLPAFIAWAFKVANSNSLWTRAVSSASSSVIRRMLSPLHRGPGRRRSCACPLPPLTPTHAPVIVILLTAAYRLPPEVTDACSQVLALPPHGASHTAHRIIESKLLSIEPSGLIRPVYLPCSQTAERILFVMLETTHMNATDRARRAATLCCHFARNFAYYSVFRKSALLNEEGFWLTVFGDFVDVCVLEWCKLFGNRNGKYHWQNVLPDPDAFRRDLCLYGISEIELKRQWNAVKDYRDHFVAHLEEQETTAIPDLNRLHLLTEFYFEKLQASFPVLQEEDSLPPHFDRYYDRCLKQAQEVLQQFDGGRHG